MTETHAPKSPYVGPRAFQSGEQLFGRDYETHELLNQFISERVVLLHSPSGAGKSSLVQAGLLPCLKEEGFQVLPVIRVSHPVPQTTVGRGFNRYVYSTLLSLEERLPPDQRRPEPLLIGMTLAEYLDGLKAEIADREAEEPPTEEDIAESPIRRPANVVLLFDQFEEILTIDPNDQDGKMTFFTQLGEALRDRSRWALFAMREEFLPALTPFLRPIPTHLSNQYRLDFLDFESAAESIRKPAELAGVEFTLPAAELLINDLRRVQTQQPDGSFNTELGRVIEPLQLQVVCLRLWNGLALDDNRIDERDVEALGNVNVSLSEYYNQTVGDISRELNIHERKIRTWFHEQLITPSGIRGQVLLEPGQTKGLDNKAVYRLVNAHLVRSEKRGGATWFELAHDRLISPVRESNQVWFEANLSLLQKQAALWDAQGRPEGMLLRGKELDDGKAWARDNYQDLTPVERRFLKLCDDAISREQAAQQLREKTLLLDAERERAELAQRRADEQKRAASRMRMMLALISALFLVALVLTGYARMAALFSEEQAAIARAASTQAVSANTEVAVERDAAIVARNTALAAKNTAEAAITEAAVAYELNNLKRAQLTQQAEEASSLQANLSAIIVQQAVAEPTQAPPTPVPTDLPVGDVDRAAQLIQAANNPANSPDLRLLLAIEANRLAGTQLARWTLIDLLSRELSAKNELLGLPLKDKIARSPSQGLPSNGQSGVSSLAFSPDGATLSAVSGGELAHWNLASSLQSWKPVPADVPYQAASGVVEGLFYSPSGALSALVTRADSGLQIKRPLLPPTEKKPAMVNGVFISARHPKVDWIAAREDIAFGYARATVYDTIIDSSFADHWYGMKSAGIPRGAFHVLSFQTDPVAQAKKFLEVTSLQPGDLPPLLDIEPATLRSTMTSEEKIRWVLRWVEYVRKESGLIPVIYVSPDSDLDNSLRSDARLRDYPVWLSRTFQAPIPSFIIFNRPWLFWHFSDNARVAGISSGVNLVSFNGSINDLQALAAQAYQASLQEAGTGKLLVTSDSEMTNPVTTRSGRYLAYRSGDSIYLIEALTYTRVLQVQQAGTLLAISEAGRYILINDGRSPVLVTFDQQVIPLRMPAPVAAAVSPDGQSLALVDNSGSVHLVRMGKAYSALEIETLGIPIKASRVAFNIDGQSMMIGSIDGLVGWWHLNSSTWEILSTRSLDGAVTVLVAGPEPNLYALGGADGQVILWDLRRETLFQRACQLAGRNLTDREWQTHLGNQPYQKTCESLP